MANANENHEAQEKKKSRLFLHRLPMMTKKKEQNKKEKNREQKPFMQVDRGGNMISNFLSNFLRQLNNPKHTGLLGLLKKLLRKGKPEGEPEPQRPAEVMGASKTVFEGGKAKPQYGGAPKNGLNSAKQDNRQSTDNHLDQKQKDEPKVIPIAEPNKRALRR